MFAAPQMGVKGQFIDFFLFPGRLFALIRLKMNILDFFYHLALLPGLNRLVAPAIYSVRSFIKNLFLTMDFSTEGIPIMCYVQDFKDIHLTSFQSLLTGCIQLLPGILQQALATAEFLVRQGKGLFG